MKLSSGKALRRLLLIMGLMGNTPLPALGLLPDSGCRNPANLHLLRHCNPYKVQLIFVDPAQLVPRRDHGNRFNRGLPHTRPYLARHRLTLQRLIQRYIDYEERIQLRRPVGHHRRQIPPTRSSKPKSKPVTAPTPSVTVNTLPPKPSEPKPEENATTPPLQESTQEENLSVSPPAPANEKNVTVEAVPKVRASLTAPKPPAEPESLVHRVEAGESLIRLARRYRTTPYDIRRWNHLKKGHLLRVGEKLTIHPGQKSSPEEIRKGKLLESYGKYQVKKGDTLLGLAKRFGVKATEIRHLNGLNRYQHLRIGQKLILPLSQKKIDTVLQREKGFRFKYTGDYRFKHKLRVTATAYTSHRGQTDRTPFIAAWNNRIRPGMKIIAVSPDLIRKYGITNGTRVKISGLRGIYTVRDKMNPRLRNHIDIYMGVDRRKALRWGRRRVILYW